MKVQAYQINKQLAKRHQNDLFYAEVKNGPTWTSNNLLILDALAIKKSWTQPCITGYEIKVDRSDFTRDEKWHGYLQYCNKFYFACPKGLIEPEELPAQVGLVYYDPEKDTIRTKRKALHKEITLSAEVLLYLLFYRTESDRYPFFSKKQEYFKEWLESKQINRDFGRTIGTRMAEEIQKLSKENTRLKDKLEYAEEEIKGFEPIRQICRDAGIQTYKWGFAQELKKALSGKVNPQMQDNINAIERAVVQLKKAVGGGDS